MGAARYTLFANRNSGHSYKVALALEICEIGYRLVDLDLSGPRRTRPAEFQAYSRFGEVPVLVMDDTAMCQSNSILRYLAQQTGQKQGGRRGDDVQAIEEWLCWEANRIGFSVSNLRYARRVDENPATEVLAYLEKRAKSDLLVLDQALSESPFLVGDKLTIADISCCGYLFWLDEAGLDVTEWPSIVSWLSRIASHPRWQHPTKLVFKRRQ
ncbi:MAG: glutathione S-transferase family protein [Pseudomonadota bacterium]